MLERGNVLDRPLAVLTFLHRLNERGTVSRVPRKGTLQGLLPQHEQQGCSFAEEEVCK